MSARLVFLCLVVFAAAQENCEFEIKVGNAPNPESVAPVKEKVSSISEDRDMDCARLCRQAGGCIVAVRLGTVCRFYSDAAVFDAATEDPSGDAVFLTNIKCGPEVQHRREKRSSMMRGQIAKRREWPWLLRLDLDNDQICGGSLLRVSDSVEESDIAITALHCLYDNEEETMVDLTRLSVIAGDYSLTTTEKTEQKSTVVNVRVLRGNENTDGIGRGDFVVLRLNSYLVLTRHNNVSSVKFRPIEFNKAVKPINLPLSGYKFPTNLNFWVAGWGKLGDGTRPDRPRELRLPLLSNSECDDINPTAELCAGYGAGKKRGVCRGDSGGPLSFEMDGKWFLGGIVSNGVLCRYPDVSPGLYTRVPTYVNFIKKAMCDMSMSMDLDLQTRLDSCNNNLDGSLDSENSDSEE